MSGGPEKTLKSPRVRERFTWNTGNPGKAGPTFSPGRNSQNVAAWEYSLGPLPGTIPWELVRHADSQALYQTSWTWLAGAAIYGLTGHPGESDPRKKLKLHSPRAAINEKTAVILFIPPTPLCHPQLARIIHFPAWPSGPPDKAPEFSTPTVKLTPLRKREYNILMRLLFVENDLASFYPNLKRTGMWTFMFRITWNRTKMHPCHTCRK